MDIRLGLGARFGWDFVLARIGFPDHRAQIIAIVEMRSEALHQHPSHDPLAAKVNGGMPAIARAPLGLAAFSLGRLEACPREKQAAPGCRRRQEPGQQITAARPETESQQVSHYNEELYHAFSGGSPNRRYSSSQE